jgi:hypothetical protein
MCLALGMTVTTQPQEPVPVLVELFTSEGCSSCPPADRLLAELVEKQPIAGVRIIAVAFHVDYWDSLGWRDPFASKQFTDRQHAYADTMHLRSIYTPQMIVSGRSEFVGSDRNAARRAIAAATKEPTGRIGIDLSNNAKPDSIEVVVRVSALPKLGEGGDLKLILVLTEDDLHSSVARGENAGRKLDHSSVARALVLAPLPGPSAGDTTTIPIDRAWRRDRLHVVAFVQDVKTMRVLCVATRPVTSP